MKNIIAGILIGIMAVLGVNSVYALNRKEVAENVTKFQDGNTVCYVYKEMVFNLGDVRSVGGISCVRVK